VSEQALSFWLETAGDLTPRPALPGTVDVDVAVLGAGYTGLWTSWYLLQHDPTLRVGLCEAAIAGFGGSGRNGGWCVAGMGLTAGELARRAGAEAARRTARTMRATVDEVGRVCAEQGIDAGFHRGGVLRVARGRHEEPSLRAHWDELCALGLAEGHAWLDVAALAERVRVGDGRAAVFSPHAAVVHPGRLVRGLAAAVERAGATIWERTPVRDVLPGPRPTLRTAHGDVRADTVVLAGEAWLAELALTRRAVLPVYSLIVLTEPLTAEQWAAIGWTGRECLSSQRYTVDYLARTEDGRILFGGRGAPYHYGSRIRPEYDRHGATHGLLRAQLREWFPALHDVRFTHAWGGPIGMPRDFMPTFRHDPRTGLAGAWGFTGQGVATSNLAGRTLADLILGRDTDLRTLPMVNHRSRRWEPEPLRWLGARYVQRGLARIDRQAQATGRPPSGRRLPERLIRH
jgi:glycine/D-amino acid oxidase-like deaminating enzyme